ncbi:hypothetical protein ACU4GR_13410 [Methylobacterium oryzae CBMB20]
MFALQERVADSVAAAIEPTLQQAEIGRPSGAPPRRGSTPTSFCCANAHLSAFTGAGMEAALACLGEALVVEPDYASAMAATA